MSEDNKKKGSFGVAEATFIGRIGHVETVTFPLKEGQTEADRQIKVSLYTDFNGKSNIFKLIVRNGLAKAIGDFLTVGRVIYARAGIAPRNYETEMDVTLKTEINGQKYTIGPAPHPVTRYITEYYVNELKFLDKYEGGNTADDIPESYAQATPDTEDNTGAPATPDGTAGSVDMSAEF